MMLHVPCLQLVNITGCDSAQQVSPTEVLGCKRYAPGGSCARNFLGPACSDNRTLLTVTGIDISRIFIVSISVGSDSCEVVVDLFADWPDAPPNILRCLLGSGTGARLPVVATTTHATTAGFQGTAFAPVFVSYQPCPPGVLSIACASNTVGWRCRDGAC